MNNNIIFNNNNCFGGKHAFKNNKNIVFCKKCPFYLNIKCVSPEWHRANINCIADKIHSFKLSKKGYLFCEKCPCVILIKKSHENHQLDTRNGRLSDMFDQMNKKYLSDLKYAHYDDPLDNIDRPLSDIIRDMISNGYLRNPAYDHYDLYFPGDSLPYPFVSKKTLDEELDLYKLQGEFDI